MEEMKFNSLNELYTRLYPAFNTKKEELLKEENINTREIDIWNFLKDTIWSKSAKLNMYDMVNDIFNLDLPRYLEFLKSKDEKGK